MCRNRIYDSIQLRAKFKREFPNKEILDGRATYFTLNYVNWLEQQIIDNKSKSE